jgi:hypothetical protein
MANQRSKNKQQAPISFTKEEIAQLEVFQKSMKMNRSDLVRRALADWMQQKRASGNEAKKWGGESEDFRHGAEGDHGGTQSGSAEDTPLGVGDGGGNHHGLLKKTDGCGLIFFTV